jgi:Integrase core domain
MIHADLSGKMPVPSLGGAKYFLLMRDEASCFRAVVFLKHKSDTAAEIKLFITFISNQTGNKVKVFKTDNGTEFVNDGLEEFFTQNGIIHQTTVPYCPESNGKVERDMRTIKDSARTMLQQAQLPDFLWAEAVGTTVYVLNRTLNKQNVSRTPLEQVMNKKPHLSHLRVFGCTAFAQIPKEKRKVWEPKAKKYILVGYDAMSTKFRLYDKDTRSIIIARHVSFDEGTKDVLEKLQFEEEEPGTSDKENDDSDADDESEEQTPREGSPSRSISPVEPENVSINVENAAGEATASTSQLLAPGSNLPTSSQVKSTAGKQKKV